MRSRPLNSVSQALYQLTELVAILERLEERMDRVEAALREEPNEQTEDTGGSGTDAETGNGSGVAAGERPAG